MHSYGSRHADCLRSIWLSAYGGQRNGGLSPIPHRRRRASVGAQVSGVGRVHRAGAGRADRRGTTFGMKRRQLPNTSTTSAALTVPLLIAASLASAVRQQPASSVVTAVSVAPGDTESTLSLQEVEDLLPETQPSARSGSQQRTQAR